jgi:hypothetical protein
MSQDQPLSKVQSALLFAMWRRRRGGDGRLSTAKELLGHLTSGKHSIEFAGLDEKKLKKPLRRLLEMGLVESGSAPKHDPSEPGPPPTGYRLPEEGKMITWQSTARLVLELFNDPHRPVNGDRFINRMMQIGLCQDDTSDPSTKEEIGKQIEYCVRKGYLRDHKDADSHSGVIQAGSFQCTAMVDQHLEFLELIAIPKRPAATETGTPPIVSDSGSLGGGGLQS